MKHFLPVFLFFLFLTYSAFSQTPSPTLPPVEEDHDVVKITTNLIQVDVTVTDAKGKIVTDLKPEEIEIYENDKKQAITNFSFINSQIGTAEKQVRDKNAARNTPLIPVSPAALKPEQVRRTVAIVVDDLSLSFQSAHTARQALRKFVDEQMQPTDLVAIVFSGSGANIQQQFTSDKRQLYLAIERIQWVGPGGKVGTFTPLAGGLPYDVPDVVKNNPAEKNAERLKADIFATGTLGALNYVVWNMRDLPGRKSVVLFSEGFSLKDPDGEYRVRKAIQYLADLSNRASVKIYTVDARGLETIGLTATDNAMNMKWQDLNAIVDDRIRQFADSQEGLVYLAEATGGLAIKNTNDLNEGVQRVLDDQTSYYLIGYQPDDETFDPQKARFNKLTIKVSRPGTSVRYRSGFFAVASENIKAAPKSVRRRVEDVLSSPFPATDIAVRLTPIFTTDETQGSFINSLIYVKASDLHFIDEPNGWKKAVFDIVVRAFDGQGKATNSISKTQTLRVRDKIYEESIREGIVFTLPFHINKPGGYQMRVALRDTVTSKIGSASQFIEVPDKSKSGLVLSGIILKNVKKGQRQPENREIEDEIYSASLDTALREFHAGSELDFSVMAFNPRIDKTTGQPKLKIQLKIFQGNNEIFAGAEEDYIVGQRSDLQKLPLTGSLNLGTVMKPGQYLLQVLVTDTLAGQKDKIHPLWTDFEIVK
jgi:VWFA-related protein